MARKPNRVAWSLAAIGIALLLAMVAMYALNPFGTDSLDPRERIIGYGIYRIPSAAMSPTIEAGQIVFANVRYYGGHDPKRGEIVVLRMPGRGIRVVKRIVGLPGESIAIRRGEVEIDGRRLPEPYVARANTVRPYSLELSPFLVPKDAYFVLGDNRDNSEDSRVWGVVGRKDLQARVTDP
jgi:signal peptidase I